MANATIKTNCTKCGAVVIKTATKHNRREANEWETWANNQDCLCDDCRKATQAEKMEAEYDIVEMHYGEYKKNYSSYPTVPNSYDAQTKTIKVCVAKKTETADAGKAGNGFIDKSVIKTISDGANSYLRPLGINISQVNKSQLFKTAHAAAKALKAAYPEIDYRAQFGAILKMLCARIKEINAVKAA